MANQMVGATTHCDSMLCIAACTLSKRTCWQLIGQTTFGLYAECL
jgi:hypothetical protein